MYVCVVVLLNKKMLVCLFVFWQHKCYFLKEYRLYIIYDCSLEREVVKQLLLNASNKSPFILVHSHTNLVSLISCSYSLKLFLTPNSQWKFLTINSWKLLRDKLECSHTSQSIHAGCFWTVHPTDDNVSYAVYCWY